MNDIKELQVNTTTRNLTVSIKDGFSNDAGSYYATINLEDTYHNILSSKLVRGFSYEGKEDEFKVFRITIIEEAIMMVRQLNLVLDELNFVELSDGSYYSKFVANAFNWILLGENLKSENQIMPKSNSAKLLYTKVLYELIDLEKQTNSIMVLKDQKGNKIDLVGNKEII